MQMDIRSYPAQRFTSELDDEEDVPTLDSVPADAFDDMTWSALLNCTCDHRRHLDPLKSGKKYAKCLRCRVLAQDQPAKTKSKHHVDPHRRQEVAKIHRHPNCNFKLTSSSFVQKHVKVRKNGSTAKSNISIQTSSTSGKKMEDQSNVAPPMSPKSTLFSSHH